MSMQNIAQNVENKESKVKIFVGYQNPNTIFHSNVFQPILTSQINWENAPEIIKDNTGINIAEHNKNYAELSGHYWVWKNFLPITNAEYIGFCHYRRFLDFNFTQMEGLPFKPILKSEFNEIFKKYSEENIMNCIEGYDIILPKKFYFLSPVYNQYIGFHPKKDIDIALLLLKEICPEYLKVARDFISGKELYTCLNFIMKKELLNEYMEWIFKILMAVEARSDWSQYKDYFDIRTPAYIAERFFNIWLKYNIEKRNLKVLNTTSIMVVGEGYGDIDAEAYIENYYNHLELLKQQIAE